MALTFKEIWSRYSQFEMKRQMYVKRLRRDGTYEDDWQEISQGMMQDGSINRIQRSLPNSSYQFGKLQVANANMRIMSAYREFADESVPGSIFMNFVRHWSKIKVVDSIVDRYSNLKRVLQINFNGEDGATTYTAETGQTVTFGGDAELDTAQKFSGQSSLLLDGTSDYVTVPDSADWNFGTGDFAIKLRCRFADLTGNQGIFGVHDDGSNFFIFFKDSDNKLSFNCTVGGVAKARYIMTSAWSGLAADTWYEILLVRSGASIRIFIDDENQVLTETVAIGSNDMGDRSDVFMVGGGGVGQGTYINGWINKFEIFKEDSVRPYDKESVTTFQGLIDATTATTEQDFESFTALDFITVLDQVSVSALTLTKTTLSELVYEIMNRSEFTNYFNVSSAAAYIDPGYDATSIDTSEYDGSVLEMLQDLAKGHSIFYIDPEDEFFYFKEALPTDDVQFSFLEKNNRKLSISRYREGKDRQITKWYWEDTDPVISAIASATTPITENFSIQGVTSAAQRQATLDFVIGKTRAAKAYFNLELPFFPIIKILDKVVVQSYGSAPVDAIRWGMFIWTDTDTASPGAAPRWAKATGIKISSSERWMVRGITHDKNLKTTLELEATS